LEAPISVKSFSRCLYRNNLKNRFLAASAFRSVLLLARALPLGQWSLVPDQNGAELPGQNPDSSGCFGIYRNNLKNRFLAASAFRTVLILARALPLGQWSLAPNQNGAELPGQNPDSLGCFGI
jgi:hypothetical protein